MSTTGGAQTFYGSRITFTHCNDNNIISFCIVLFCFLFRSLHTIYYKTFVTWNNSVSFSDAMMVMGFGRSTRLFVDLTVKNFQTHHTHTRFELTFNLFIHVIFFSFLFLVVCHQRISFLTMSMYLLFCASIIFAPFYYCSYFFLFFKRNYINAHALFVWFFSLLLLLSSWSSPTKWLTKQNRDRNGHTTSGIWATQNGLCTVTTDTI